MNDTGSSLGWLLLCTYYGLPERVRLFVERTYNTSGADSLDSSRLHACRCTVVCMYYRSSSMYVLRTKLLSYIVQSNKVKNMVPSYQNLTRVELIPGKYSLSLARAKYLVANINNVRVPTQCLVY